MIDYNYHYNKEYYEGLLEVEHLVERDVRWRILPKGIILPHKDVDGDICGGLLDESGSYVDGSALHRGAGGSYDYSSANVTECDEDIVFLGLWADVWGHCLTDNIRRLWVLRDETFMNRYGSLRFLYIPMYGRSPGKNFRELLDILGAGAVRIEPINRITRFRNVILPDECFFEGKDGIRLFTREYQTLIDCIRDYGEAHFKKTADRKLYFTYRHFPAMRGIGERKLERFFMNLGYRVVSPENYSFAEQLNMLLNCEAFASTIGSVSHNCIFMRDHAKVHLIPRVGFIPEYQLALDQVHNLDITYVDSTLSLYANQERPWDGPFYFIVSQNLQECFDQSCGCRAGGVDFLVYRNLAYAVNGSCIPSGYYDSILHEYFPAGLRREPKRIPLAKLWRRYRFRKLVVALFG